MNSRPRGGNLSYEPSSAQRQVSCAMPWLAFVPGLSRHLRTSQHTRCLHAPLHTLVLSTSLVLPDNGKETTTIERGAKREDVGGTPCLGVRRGAAKVEDLGSNVAPVAMHHVLPCPLCAALSRANLVIIGAVLRLRLCRASIPKVALLARVQQCTVSTHAARLRSSNAVHMCTHQPRPLGTGRQARMQQTRLRTCAPVTAAATDAVSLPALDLCTQPATWLSLALAPGGVSGAVRWRGMRCCGVACGAVR